MSDEPKVCMLDRDRNLANPDVQCNNGCQRHHSEFHQLHARQSESIDSSRAHIHDTGRSTDFGFNDPVVDRCL